jgi:hypothetical protein
MKKTIALALGMLCALVLLAASVYDDVSNAFTAGSADKLAVLCAPNIDLTLLNTEGVYSKVQTQQILKKFFVQHPPGAFKIQHQGASKEGSMYGIGRYEDKNGEAFRISFYLKQFNGQNLIREMRFEKE